MEVLSFQSFPLIINLTQAAHQKNLAKILQSVLMFHEG